MGKLIVALLLGFVQAVLKRTANLLWEDLWEKLFAAIAEVEARFKDDAGEQKKQWVMERLEEWLKEKVQLNWVQNLLFKMVIGRLIDAIVAELNRAMGHDWIETARQFERQMAEWLPVID